MEATTTESKPKDRINLADEHPRYMPVICDSYRSLLYLLHRLRTSENVLNWRELFWAYSALDCMSALRYAHGLRHDEYLTCENGYWDRVAVEPELLKAFDWLKGLHDKHEDRRTPWFHEEFEIEPSGRVAPAMTHRPELGDQDRRERLMDQCRRAVYRIEAQVAIANS